MLHLLLSLTALAADSDTAGAPTDWPSEDDPAPWTTTATGIQVQDLVAGTGAEVVDRAGVEVHYVGMLADGTQFDASRDRGQTFTFRVGQHNVISGWEEGVLGMKVGGVRRLVIPPAQGYGSKSVGPIPPDSVLYFEIELVGVTPPRAAPDAPAEVPDEGWKVLDDGVRCADLAVGDGAKAKAGGRVCIDWVVWKDGREVDQTYDNERCTWLRLDDGELPPLVEEGLAKMRAGGVREIVLPSGEIWHVEVTSAAK